MLDTRPLEKISSIIILVAVSVLALSGLVLVPVGLLIGADGGGVLAGAGCCAGVGGVAFAVAMQALLRWSRTGKARPFLTEVANRVGGGEVQTATWLLSLLSPRLEGHIDGFRYTLSLRRQGGILSPSTVSGGTMGWRYTVRMDARVGARIGFGPPGQTLGAGLLGLTHPVQTGRLTAWTGGTPRGHALAEHLAGQPNVLELIHFGGTTALLCIGPEAITMMGPVPRTTSPEAFSWLLGELARIARVVTSG